jgi:hypothetical protein
VARAANAGQHTDDFYISPLLRHNGTTERSHLIERQRHTLVLSQAGNVEPRHLEFPIHDSSAVVFQVASVPAAPAAVDRTSAVARRSAHHSPPPPISLRSTVRVFVDVRNSSGSTIRCSRRTSGARVWLAMRPTCDSVETTSPACSRRNAAWREIDAGTRTRFHPDSGRRQAQRPMAARRLSEHTRAPNRPQRSRYADVARIGLVGEVGPAEGAFSAATRLN